MTMPGDSWKALATQNTSEWPCSTCPIPLGSGLWGEDILYIFFLTFPGHLEFWTPLQIPSWGPPLGCNLFQWGKYFHHRTYSPVLCLLRQLCSGGEHREGEWFPSGVIMYFSFPRISHICTYAPALLIRFWLLPKLHGHSIYIFKMQTFRDFNFHEGCGHLQYVIVFT